MNKVLFAVILGVSLQSSNAFAAKNCECSLVPETPSWLSEINSKMQATRNIIHNDYAWGSDYACWRVDADGNYLSSGQNTYDKCDIPGNFAWGRDGQCWKIDSHRKYLSMGQNSYGKCESRDNFALDNNNQCWKIDVDGNKISYGQNSFDKCK